MIEGVGGGGGDVGVVWAVVWTDLARVARRVQKPVQCLVHRGDAGASREHREGLGPGERVLLLHIGLDVLEPHLSAEVVSTSA